MAGPTRGTLLVWAAVVVVLVVAAGLGFGYVLAELSVPWAEVLGFALGVVVVAIAASLVYYRRYVARPSHRL